MTALRLDPVVRGDAKALIRANRENRDFHHPWVEPITEPAAFHAWLEDIAGGATLGLIAREPGGGIVGLLNFSQIFRRGFQNAYLGFYGMAAFAGRGLMTEAVRLGVAHAFDVVGLHRIEANIQPANARSVALVQRVGFRREGYSPRYLKVNGEWRDHERWALLAEDPRS